jgi:hypothetical protein
VAGFFTTFLVTSLDGGSGALVGVVQTVGGEVGTNVSCILAGLVGCEAVGKGSVEREVWVMFWDFEWRFREGAVSGTCDGERCRTPGLAPGDFLPELAPATEEPIIVSWLEIDEVLENEVNEIDNLSRKHTGHTPVNHAVHEADHVES